MQEEIKVLNYIEGLSEEYKIYSQQEITKDNLQTLFDNKNDKIITNVIIKDDFIVTVYIKIKNQLDYENSNIKEIALNAFGLSIIKPNLKKSDSNKNQEININIPIKGEKIISKKNFFAQNYYFYDFITIDDSKNYLIVYLFSQLHIFKIYQKNETLKYNKITQKNFENKNNKFKAMYLGTNVNKNRNILEIGLILKPENTFLFLNVDISDKNMKMEENEYLIDKDKYKNILNRFKRSFCGKFIFTNKETNQKYLIYKDDNKKEMIVKELEINHIWDDDNQNGNNFYYIYNIGDKTYIISEIEEKGEEQNNNNILFGIYNLIYDKEKDKYLINLIQKIKIKNEDGTKDYLINIDSSNCLSVNFKESLIFILFDEKGSVDSINKIKLNANNLEISKNFSEKFKEWSLLVLFIKDEIYFWKFSDEFEKLGKCIIKYEIKKIESTEKKEDTNNESEKNEKENHNKKNKKKSHKKHDEKNDEIEEEEDNSEYNNTMKELIEEIIKKRTEKNMKKIEKLKKENDKKIKIIKDDINLQNKELEILDKKFNDLLKRAEAINKMKKSFKEENEDEEEEEKEINNNSHKNKNIDNNYYTKNPHYTKKQNLNKINIMNNQQINQYRQINQEQMMNQFNIQNPNPNPLYLNNIINLNDPIIKQLLLQQIQQQQQRNMLNQGNYFLPNMNNNNFH